MTDHIKIQGITPRIQYVANGETTVFEFPFAIFKSGDVNVYLDDTLQSSDTYQVDFTSTEAGGSVTFETAPENQTVVTIVRHLTIERTSDFQEGGALRSNTLNDELDYQIACQQQIADSLNRSMVLPPYAVNTNVNLTLPLPQAGKAIVWNADGTNLENSTVAVNALESTLNGYKTAAETAATTATAKAAEIVGEVDSKANIDMNNLSTAGKKKIPQLVMPSSSYLDMTLDVSGSTYTAPANGWFVIRKEAGAADKYLRLFIKGTLLGNQITSPISNGTLETYIPVKTGDTIGVDYNATGSTQRFRFIYAEGEV